MAKAKTRIAGPRQVPASHPSTTITDGIYIANYFLLAPKILGEIW
jgi:hypothetical protein